MHQVDLPGPGSALRTTALAAATSASALPGMSASGARSRGEKYFVMLDDKKLVNLS